MSPYTYLAINLAIHQNLLKLAIWVFRCVTESFHILKFDRGLLIYATHESPLGPDEDLYSSSLKVIFSTTLCFRLGYLEKIILYDGSGAEE